MEKKHFNGLMVLILGMVSLSLMADTKAYKIELLIFAQDMPSSEVFDQYESRIEWPQRLSDMSRYNQASASLGGIKAKLHGSTGYRTLMHVAWTQTIGSNRYGTAVQIENSAGTVNGFFRIQRGHYLHMMTDLEYSPRGSIIYRLNEKRRFKLREIHYLDHPKFGVIARVTPL